MNKKPLAFWRFQTYVGLFMYICKNILLNKHTNTNLIINSMKKIFSVLLMGAFFAACNQTTPVQEQTPAAQTVNVAAIKTIELHVTGMTCEGCENTVKEAVNKIGGVTESNASFQKEAAIVSFDTTMTNLATITKTIDDLGYKVEGLMQAK